MIGIIDDGIDKTAIVGSCLNIEIVRRINTSRCNKVILDQKKGWIPSNVGLVEGIGVRSILISTTDKALDLSLIQLSNATLNLSVESYVDTINSVLRSEFPDNIKLNLFIKDKDANLDIGKPTNVGFSLSGNAVSLNISSKESARVRNIFVDGMSRLTSLSIESPLDEIEIVKCPKIEKFYCPIGSIKSFRVCGKANLDCYNICKMTDLRELHLDQLGKLESLPDIQEIKRLNTFVMWGSTNILDGDLGVLLKLPNLSSVFFVDRTHYSPRASQIKHLNEPARDS